MSRTWKHYPNGVETDWPAGTLPHGDSVFRADFLNQFVGWARYTQAVAGLADTFPAIPFVKVGDNVQTAAFWKWLFNCDQSFFVKNVFRKPTTYAIGEIVSSASSYLGNDPEYMAAIEPYLTDHYWPSVGEIIQPIEAENCPMRTRLLNLRIRLDLLKNIPAMAKCSDHIRKLWRNAYEYYPDYPSGYWESSETYTSATLAKARESPKYFKFVEFEEFSARNVYVEKLSPPDVPCSAHFGHGTINETNYQAYGGTLGFVTTGENTSNIYVSDSMTDMPTRWNVFTDPRYLDPAPDYPALWSDPPNHIGVNVLLFYWGIIHPLDELPDEYKP